MRTIHFDCFSGAAGDMIVGALIDAGASWPQIQESLSALGVSGYSAEIEKVCKQGMSATQFHVRLDESHSSPHRGLTEIRSILHSARLTPFVANRCDQVFERLAQAEAQAHGIDVERVHFHEVGAIDAIVDVVAAMTALESLDAGRITCSRIATGAGTVRCAHGVLPVPAPATAILLRGVPICECDEPGELLTPTGAAILTTICDEFGVIAAMSIDRIGNGAGTRDNASRPNVLRVLVGSDESGEETDMVTVLETNIDDAPGQWVGHCLDRLVGSGALDAYCVPIYMKKQRPGVVLTAMCAPADAQRLEQIIFAETTTFGIRRSTMQRSKLVRRMETVTTKFGAVRIKVGHRSDVSTATPEYEDCVAAAAAHSVALRTVVDAAIDVWRKQGK